MGVERVERDADAADCEGWVWRERDRRLVWGRGGEIVKYTSQ